VRPRVAIGAVLCGIGLLWIGQGIGAVGGSFMTGETIWAVFGAISVLIGVVVLKGPRRDD